MIPVYDYRHDADRNVIVRPELRGRFLRLEPAPLAPPHSHDLAGEVFLVLEGECEFLVEDERITCRPGQLIYVDKMTRHSLRATGSQPCVVYLSVAPHVEPTHTFYDGDGGRLPPRYDAWRGTRYPDGSADRIPPEPDPDFRTGELTQRYLDELRLLAEAAQDALRAGAKDGDGEALSTAAAAGDEARAKVATDAMWFRLRSVLQQVGLVEEAWNRLAPQVTAHCVS